MISPSTHRLVFLVGPTDFRGPAAAATRMALADATRSLRHRGFVVQSLHELALTGSLTDANVTRRGLREVAGADAVVLVTGWRCSPPAMAFVAAARAVGMPVVDHKTLAYVDPALAVSGGL